MARMFCAPEDELSEHPKANGKHLYLDLVHYHVLMACLKSFSTVPFSAFRFSGASLNFPSVSTLKLLMAAGISGSCPGPSDLPTTILNAAISYTHPSFNVVCSPPHLLQFPWVRVIDNWSWTDREGFADSDYHYKGCSMHVVTELLLKSIY
mmetsp:Transcript_7313/g.10442  ORF Transcript_7313/g.10442 Transcript_7313/m.10442 type:complete len:151 (-) Transcript_7313:1646-2098(-)